MMKMRIISFCTLFIFLFFHPALIQAQDDGDMPMEMDADSSSTEKETFYFDDEFEEADILSEEMKPEDVKKFDDEKIEEYLNNPDYQYDRLIDPQRETLWQSIQRWFWEWVQQLFFNSIGRDSFNTILLIIISIVTLYIALIIFKANKTFLFNRGAVKTGISMSELDENIHQLDFEKLIREAILAGLFASAVRLFYLKTLKQLSDKNLINWQPGKTNHEYIKELQNALYRKEFEELTSVFEYTYYGDFQVGEYEFKEVETQFQQFSQLLLKNG